MKINQREEVNSGYHIFRLVAAGKKAHVIKAYTIKPEKNKNPVARDNTLKARNENLKTWKKTKDPKLKNYENVLCMNSLGEDKIIVKILEEGVYNEKDKERKGEWMAPYFFLFSEYDPNLSFVATLPTIIEGDFTPDITVAHSKMHKIIYNRNFSFEALLENWSLNDFLTQEQKERMRVHYNFLSLFVHPNKHQLDIRLKWDYIKRKEFLEYEENKYAGLLALLYIVKIQEIFLRVLAERLEELSQKRWAKPFIEEIRKNASVANGLWFIYDDPTPFDREKTRIIRLQKERRKKSEEQVSSSAACIYYSDPIYRLKQFYPGL